MRFKNFMLIALIWCIITSCQDAKKSEKQDSVDFKASELSSYNKIIDSLLANRKLDSTQGSLIKSDVAADMLNKYKAQRRGQDPGYDPKQDIYGFGFGIAVLRDFLQKIDQHNKRYANQSDTIITGVRVYMAYRDYKDPTNGNIKEIPDVFLMPVLNKAGNNIYDIDQDFNNQKNFQNEDPFIVETSKPCPNQCD